MMLATQQSDVQELGGFRHEAFLYSGDDEFLDGAAAFVRGAMAADQPVLLAVSQLKGERLRGVLGEDLAGHADDVVFADIAQLGRNPARIIPAWRQFVATHQAAGRGARGIGEPVWAGRTPPELREVQRHDSLLNVAFSGVHHFWLVCPYDVSALPSEVVDEAYRSHPYVLERGGSSVVNEHLMTPVSDLTNLDDPLPEPGAAPLRLHFGPDDLADLRHAVAGWAADGGMRSPRLELLVLAVNELTTNSVEHGGGQGELLLWRESDALLAEVRDGGYIPEPLVGRIPPEQQQRGGRGVWLVNQVCDLVQIRSTPDGTAVRVHMSL
jgi:anti-sigma regulatory factor (Ser/Thr protein kinase)